jgi:hypothetical protein
MPESSAATPGKRSGWRHRISEQARFVIELIIFVTAVFFLGWGADALARAGAEALLARNIQNATGVSEPPLVDVKGFAFVPQVVRGAYDEVHVTTRDIASGPLRIERVDSQLFDVRVPFHDVLVQDIRRVGISRSVEDVTLRYEDLNAYFDATGRPLQLAPAENGQARLTGVVDVLSQRVQVSATVTLSAANEALRITPREVDTGSTTLSQASRLLLGQRLALSVPLGTLPFGHQLSSVAANPDGIRLRAEGVTIVVQP